MSYSLLAKYRKELMGIAILNVLVLHSLSWIQPTPSIVITALNTFGRLIFTEGFLFLSGYGLYYSLYKNSNLRDFYTKRVKRLMVPYWLMTLPFFIVYCQMGEYGLGTLMLRFLTLDFWIHGNYAGMWYVAISVLLYLIMPLIFRLLNLRWGVGLLLSASTLLIIMIHALIPDYYEKISIGIAKVPFFIIGAWAGRESILKKEISLWLIALLLIVLVVLYLWQPCQWLNIREIFFRLTGISACCLPLQMTDKFTILHSCLRWFGKYTLELYIMHLMLKSAISYLSDSMLIQTIWAIGCALLLCMPIQTFCGIINIKILAKLNDYY